MWGWCYEILTIVRGKGVGGGYCHTYYFTILLLLVSYFREKKVILWPFKIFGSFARAIYFKITFKL